MQLLRIEQKPSRTRLRTSLQEPEAFCFILKPKIPFFYLVLFVFICWTTRYHLLSLVVIRCYLLSLAVPLVVTHFHSMHHFPVFFKRTSNVVIWVLFNLWNLFNLLSRLTKIFSIKLYESFPIVASISLLLLFIFFCKP